MLKSFVPHLLTSSQRRNCCSIALQPNRRSSLLPSAAHYLLVWAPLGRVQTGALVATVIALRLVPVVYRHRCPRSENAKRESRHEIKPGGEARDRRVQAAQCGQNSRFALNSSL